MASKDYERILVEQRANIRQEAMVKVKGAENEATNLMSRWQQIKPKTTNLDK